MTNTVLYNRQRTAAHWIKENEPEIWSKTKKYVNISTYITYKISNVLIEEGFSDKARAEELDLSEIVKLYKAFFEC